MNENHGMYGERLLPKVLDQRARSEPARLYAMISKLSTDLSQGFREVTYADMAHCVDVLAHHFEDVFGHSSIFESLSYLGPPDLRGAMVFLAAVKCGYKVKAHFV